MLCLKNYNIISLQPRFQNILFKVFYSTCAVFSLLGFFYQICSHWNREKEVTITTSGPSSVGYFMTTQEGNREDGILTDETRVNSNVSVPSYNPE